MVRLRSFFMAVFFLLSLVKINAQLNHAEKVLLDSLSIYPQHAFEHGQGYVVGGVENSCHIATVWQLDENFNRVHKKHMIHDSYEISEMYDMRLGDSIVEVLTWQLQTEDVTSEEGIKWYALDPTDLTIRDSLYIPEFNSKDGLFLDSNWVVHTWDDTLLFISPADGHTAQKIPFNNGPNPLIATPSGLASWRDSMVFTIDSTYRVDTFQFDHQVLDVVSNSASLFVLTTDSVWRFNPQNTNYTSQSAEAPEGANALLFQPYIPALATFATSNSCLYLDPATLVSMERVQLYYDEVHQEDLNYVALDDRSILRLGTTRVKARNKPRTGYGQRMGFLHRFNGDYTEDAVQRSDLILKEVSILDDYYGSRPKLVLGDSAYFISTDSETRISWKFENGGHDQVGTGLVATNQLFGFNCAEGFYSQLLDTVLLPGNLAGKDFQYQKYNDLSNGYEEKLMVYTAYPNGHYDADFSDNYKYFTFRYVVSSVLQEFSAGKIDVFPNPVDQRLYVKSTKGLEIQNLELLTMRGALVAEIQSDKPSTEIELKVKTVPAGMYFLRVHTPEGVIVKKIVVAP